VKWVMVFAPCCCLCFGCDNTVRTEDDGVGLNGSGPGSNGGATQVESCEEYCEYYDAVGCCDKPNAGCSDCQCSSPVPESCAEEDLAVLQCLAEHVIPGPDGNCVDDEYVCTPDVIALNDCLIEQEETGP